MCKKIIVLASGEKKKKVGDRWGMTWGTNGEGVGNQWGKTWGASGEPVGNRWGTSGE